MTTNAEMLARLQWKDPEAHALIIELGRKVETLTRGEQLLLAERCKFGLMIEYALRGEKHPDEPAIDGRLEAVRALGAVHRPSAEPANSSLKIPPSVMLGWQQIMQLFGLNALPGHAEYMVKFVRADLYDGARQTIERLESDRNKWKQMAEYQFAKQRYPDSLELGNGALDAYFVNWSWDEAMSQQNGGD